MERYIFYHVLHEIQDIEQGEALQFKQTIFMTKSVMLIMETEC